MDDNKHNEQRAILGGGCIALVIAVVIALAFLVAAICDTIL